jgi:hypothetical protein
MLILLTSTGASEYLDPETQTNKFSDTITWDQWKHARVFPCMKKTLREEEKAGARSETAGTAVLWLDA